MIFWVVDRHHGAFGTALGRSKKNFVTAQVIWLSLSLFYMALLGWFYLLILGFLGNGTCSDISWAFYVCACERGLGVQVGDSSSHVYIGGADAFWTRWALVRT